jgi:hypothetical protein
MKRFLLSSCALLLGLTLTGSATAHEPHFVQGHGHAVAPYYRDHGIRFAGGYYYRGYEHRHWAYRTWDSYRACYLYWDPYLTCYFSWDAGRDCWYPVGY